MRIKPELLFQPQFIPDLTSKEIKQYLRLIDETIADITREDSYLNHIADDDNFPRLPEDDRKNTDIAYSSTKELQHLYGYPDELIHKHQGYYGYFQFNKILIIFYEKTFGIRFHKSIPEKLRARLTDLFDTAIVNEFKIATIPSDITTSDITTVPLPIIKMLDYVTTTNWFDIYYTLSPQYYDNPLGNYLFSILNSFFTNIFTTVTAFLTAEKEYFSAPPLTASPPTEELHYISVTANHRQYERICIEFKKCLIVGNIAIVKQFIIRGGTEQEIPLPVEPKIKIKTGKGGFVFGLYRRLNEKGYLESYNRPTLSNILSNPPKDISASATHALNGKENTTHFNALFTELDGLSDDPIQGASTS